RIFAEADHNRRAGKDGYAKTEYEDQPQAIPGSRRQLTLSAVQQIDRQPLLIAVVPAVREIDFDVACRKLLQDRIENLAVHHDLANPNLPVASGSVLGEMTHIDIVVVEGRCTFEIELEDLVEIPACGRR